MSDRKGDRHYDSHHSVRDRDRSHHSRSRDERDRHGSSRYEPYSREDRDRRSERGSGSERGSERSSDRDHRRERRESDRHHSPHSSRSRRDSHSRRDEREEEKPSSREVAPVEKPKRRSSAWDQAPESLEGLSPSEIKLRMVPGMGLFGVQNFNQATGMMGSPMTQAKRLYIGGVPSDVTDVELSQFFTEQFAQAGFSPESGAVINSVQINYERGYGFLELDTPELATAGLSFDGISFRDHTLKVRRPRDYQGADLSPVPGAIRGIVSTNVPDTPNKVFIGGLPATFTDDQVKELVGHFGELKAFHLVKDSHTNISKGYAFFEYLDPNVTDRACRALNNKDFGGKTLLVQRAHLGAKPGNIITPNQPMFDLTAQSRLGRLLNLQIAVATTLNTTDLLQITDVQPTRILVLLNMVSLLDLTDSKEIDKVKDEVEAECSKFGRVLSVVIPTAKDLDSMDTVRGVGRVFVKFENAQDAATAQKALALRKYNRRCVITSYFDEALFDKGQLDGASEEDVSDRAIEKLQEHYKNELQAMDSAAANGTSDSAQSNGSEQTNYHSVPPPPM